MNSNFQHFFIYIFLHVVCFQALFGSQQQGTQQQQQGTEPWVQLLRACFPQRPPAPFIRPPLFNTPGYFIVRAFDDFRDVTIQFSVSSNQEGTKCSLVWDDWMGHLGAIRSVRRDNGEPVSKSDELAAFLGMPLSITEVKIDIFDKPVPHWELDSLHPNNLVSGQFIRSFIAEGMRVHSRIRNGAQVYLRIIDTSSIRELYWLEHDGMTYFENVWNMFYDCVLIRCVETSRAANYIRSINLNAGKLMDAFSDQDLTFITRANPLIQDARHYFCEEFIFELQAYMQSTDQGRFSRMTVRDALNEFIPRWRNNPAYTAAQIQSIAQSTFMYFFRHHPEFHLLAMQVLNGYDQSCSTMTGYPESDGRPFAYLFLQGPPGGGLPGGGQGGPSSGQGGPSSGQGGPSSGQGGPSFGGAGPYLGDPGTTGSDASESTDSSAHGTNLFRTSGIPRGASQLSAFSAGSPAPQSGSPAPQQSGSPEPQPLPSHKRQRSKRATETPLSSEPSAPNVASEPTSFPTVLNQDSDPSNVAQSVQALAVSHTGAGPSGVSPYEANPNREGTFIPRMHPPIGQPPLKVGHYTDDRLPPQGKKGIWIPRLAPNLPMPNPVPNVTPPTASQRPKHSRKQRMPIPTLQPTSTLQPSSILQQTSSHPTRAPMRVTDRGPFVPRVGAEIELTKRQKKKRQQAPENSRGPYIPRSRPVPSYEKDNTQAGSLKEAMDTNEKGQEYPLCAIWKDDYGSNWCAHLKSRERELCSECLGNSSIQKSTLSHDVNSEIDIPIFCTSGHIDSYSKDTYLCSPREKMSQSVCCICEKATRLGKGFT